MQGGAGADMAGRPDEKKYQEGQGKKLKESLGNRRKQSVLVKKGKQRKMVPVEGKRMVSKTGKEGGRGGPTCAFVLHIA